MEFYSILKLALSHVDAVSRDLTQSTVAVLIYLLAYYLLYSLLFIYLKPYINYYSLVVSGRVRVFNIAMLIIYLSSPFNAHEAKVIHTNPVTYFVLSVIVPILSMFVP